MRSQQNFMSFVNSKDSLIPKKDSDRLCCAKCRFSTKDTDLFERHVSHHKEVTFSCALCSYVSYSKTESQKHVVLHTGSYPYRCSFCSYGAVRRDYLVKHILRIHKRSAEGVFISDSSGCPSAPETLGMSDWPERSDQRGVLRASAAQPRLLTARAHVGGARPAAARQPPSHSLGSAPQVAPRACEGHPSNSQLDSQAAAAARRSASEKPVPKSTFSRVPVGSAEPLLEMPRVGACSQTIPRVQVRAPDPTPLRQLLSSPPSRRNVHSVQMDHTGTSAPAVPPSGAIAAEKSNPSGTNSRTLVGPSTETSSVLSSVQVELLAPLNQPIQHDKPLTVSCPEEINIPAGCLVELVEVKNVNGTRELELRLIPPGGVQEDPRRTVEEPTGSELSFKCQVAAATKGTPVSPSTSPLPHALRHLRPTAEPVLSAHQTPCSSEPPAKLKGTKRSSAREIRMLQRTELSSEGLPVISSVFSLCPPPVPAPQTQPRVQETKDNVRSALIKKEEEEEEKEVKHRDVVLFLKETKTEDLKADVTVLSAPSTAEPLETSPDVPAAPALVGPDHGIAASTSRDEDPSEQRHSSASLMYPKVTLVRIPSPSGRAEQLPEAPVPENVTARPVLCCTVSEHIVSGSPEVAIKLILKRDLRQSAEQHLEPPPPRKRHKKDKRRAKRRHDASPTPPLRLTPAKDHQPVKRPGPNQPVVVLNHPHPVVRTLGAQSLRNHEWIRSTGHEREPAPEQPSLKMKLRKVSGQNYEVIELVLKGLSDHRAS